MKQFLLAITIVGIHSLAAAECSPSKLLKIVTVNASPELPEGSFATRPKTLYRLGTKYARIEEEIDSQNEIHGLVISNAPDNWLINLSKKSARHVVDPDPNGVVKAPIFSLTDFPESFPAEFGEIELGCEAAFFAKRHSPVGSLKSENQNLIKQAFGLNDWMLVLTRAAEDSPPKALFLFNHEKIVFVLKYLSFEVLEPADLELFLPPEGLTVTEEGAA